MTLRRSVLMSSAMCALLSSRVDAQGRVKSPPDLHDPPVTAAPAPRYEAVAFHRFLFGSGWRELWARPITIPVLRIDTFAGGLTPEREGGGRQSRTLHFLDARGKGWIFRSVDKYPAEKLTEDLAGTTAGDMIQDQIGAMHPAGQLMMPPLLDALGILHVQPTLYVMPDHPRLGEFRETFAGLIGALEAKPNEGENDSPGFAGSRAIRDTDDFLEEVRENARHRVADRELLRSRLLDFIVGDTDRGSDQYRWARFPHPENSSRYLWRPIPRDRDWSFHRPGGIIVKLAAGSVTPKFTPFGPEHSSVSAHTHSTHVVDRSLLTGLDREAFRAEVAAVKAALTDSVIEVAVQRLPAEYPAAHARWLADALKARRDALESIAEPYYRWLATDVDIHGTDEADHVRLVRRADGHLEVTLLAREVIADEQLDGLGGSSGSPASQLAPFYHRIFLPGETDEVRVFLRDGNDVAVVQGGESAITVRIVGGEGDDMLADSAGTAGVHLYDAEGDNRITATSHTSFSDREWHPPEPSEGIHLLAPDWAPDWGDSRGWGVDVSHGKVAGIVVGIGPTFTKYGFRRLPHHWRIDALLHTGLSRFKPGWSVALDYRLENAPHSIEAEASWPGYDSFRWFGLGNDSERITREQALVRMDQLDIRSAFVWRFGEWRNTSGEDEESEPAAEERSLRPLRGSIGLGPVVRRSVTESQPDGPFAITRPIGFDPLWQAGARTEFELKQTDEDAVPHRGYRLQASFEGFPAMLDLPGAYGTATTELNGYVPIIGRGVHLAARVGAIGALGDVPAFDAAAIGGRATLRGFSTGRFAGDAATYGGVELRVPLGDIAPIVPGTLGAFALLDAGRVWNDGESPGGWHTGYGGGLWFAAFERVVSAAWASGERGRLHVWLGMPW